MWQIRTEHFEDEGMQNVRVELWDDSAGGYEKLAVVEFNDGYIPEYHYGIIIVKDMKKE